MSGSGWYGGKVAGHDPYRSAVFSRAEFSTPVEIASRYTPVNSHSYSWLECHAANFDENWPEKNGGIFSMAICGACTTRVQFVDLQRYCSRVILPLLHGMLGGKPTVRLLLPSMECHTRNTEWWFQIFFNFQPFLGKISNLTSIFFRWVETTNQTVVLLFVECFFVPLLKWICHEIWGSFVLM